MRQRTPPTPTPLHTTAWLLILSATAMLLSTTFTDAFLAPTPFSPSQRATTSLHIGNVFGGGDSNEPQLPKDVKDAISKCRGAVQKGLENRISRMVSGERLSALHANVLHVYPPNVTLLNTTKYTLHEWYYNNTILFNIWWYNNVLIRNNSHHTKR